MGKLRIKQRHDMTPHTERARQGIDASCPGEFGDDVAGDEVAKLRENRELASGWGWSSTGFVFHTRSLSRSQSLGQLQPLASRAMGWR
jgi:hypothetical protein